MSTYMIYDTLNVNKPFFFIFGGNILVTFVNMGMEIIYFTIGNWSGERKKHFRKMKNKEFIYKIQGKSIVP